MASTGYRRPRQDEIATDIETDNAAEERKPQQKLIGYRGVYVFDVSQTEFTDNRLVGGDR